MVNVKLLRNKTGIINSLIEKNIKKEFNKNERFFQFSIAGKIFAGEFILIKEDDYILRIWNGGVLRVTGKVILK